MENRIFRKNDIILISGLFAMFLIIILALQIFRNGGNKVLVSVDGVEKYTFDLDKDIDTLWTFDFGEYNIRPGSGFTADDVLKRIYDPDPVSGAAMLADGGRHIILIHAHDETEEMVPDYFRKFIGLLPENGVMFDQPAFLAGHNPALQ